MNCSCRKLKCGYAAAKNRSAAIFAIYSVT